MRSSCIRLLLNSSSPFAIFFRIGTVVINSFDCKFFRSFSHVFIKIKKAVFPLFTYKNTPFSIPMKISVFGIMASLNHSFPYFIRACGRHSVFFSEKVIVAIFALCRNSRSKMSSFNCFYGSTLTFTNPLSLPFFFISTSGDYLPFSKLLSRKILQLFHIMKPMEVLYLGGF